mmetsp:Transcript_3718/g.12018  ORF Transcript_3718/g.12018 Transcript_3718/m.12018 type:complete len:550 (-) Transcript_3718:135-1784(-)|eukprot:CAMPEP_0170749226 /NCGR_PEP_ID=MMETSP0437-20130122/10283_1 /TAXON_ID=0 /ORGANISM="Sexangularia sp." /LENGTH=549 /DNA_ID=CAMNT_0011088137 /DNA_START=5 /DNA_END=1654 /DNA_ORIENTATION=-
MNIDMAGWLYKQSKLSGNLQRRFCCVQVDTLFFFKSPSSIVPQSGPNLDTALAAVTCSAVQRVDRNPAHDRPAHRRAPSLYSFTLYLRSGRRVQLWAETSDEVDLWIMAIGNLISAGTSLTAPTAARRRQSDAVSPRATSPAPPPASAVLSPRPRPAHCERCHVRPVNHRLLLDFSDGTQRDEFLCAVCARAAETLRGIQGRADDDATAPPSSVPSASSSPDSRRAPAHHEQAASSSSASRLALVDSGSTTLDGWASTLDEDDADIPSPPASPSPTLGSRGESSPSSPLAGPSCSTGRPEWPGGIHGQRMQVGALVGWATHRLAARGLRRPVLETEAARAFADGRLLCTLADLDGAPADGGEADDDLTRVRQLLTSLHESPAHRAAGAPAPSQAAALLSGSLKLILDTLWAIAVVKENIVDDGEVLLRWALSLAREADSDSEWEEEEEEDAALLATEAERSGDRGRGVGGWRSGMQAGRVVATLVPNVLHPSQLVPYAPTDNWRLALTTAKSRLGVPKLFDERDAAAGPPDRAALLLWLAMVREKAVVL